MIENNSVYKFVSFIVNKNVNGSFTPNGYNMASKAANIEMFDEWRGGKYSTYQPGRPVPVIGMEQNRTISEELDPFIETMDIVVQSDGVVSMPGDFVQWLSGMSIPFNRELEWVKKEDIPNRLTNPIDIPTAQFPIFTNKGKKWKFYPSMLGTISIDYLRIPKTPLWNYKAVGNKAVYDPIGTVNFEWNETAFVALCSKILSYMGFNLSNGEIVGFAENMKEAK